MSDPWFTVMQEGGDIVVTLHVVGGTEFCLPIEIARSLGINLSQMATIAEKNLAYDKERSQ
jgi:riboflavin synthase